jgi:hypothetical protein
MLLTLLVTSDASAYSDLAHEAMIDAVWADHLVPLRHRFPASFAELDSEPAVCGNLGASVWGHAPPGSEPSSWTCQRTCCCPTSWLRRVTKSIGGRFGVPTA